MDNLLYLLRMWFDLQSSNYYTVNSWIRYTASLCRNYIKGEDKAWDKTYLAPWPGDRVTWADSNTSHKMRALVSRFNILIWNAPIQFLNFSKGILQMRPHVQPMWIWVDNVTQISEIWCELCLKRVSADTKIKCIPVVKINTKLLMVRL